MITADEAEALAKKHLQDYVNARKCENLQDIGNALMKMLRVTGAGMIMTEGQTITIAMFEHVAQVLSKPEFNRPVQRETLQ